MVWTASARYILVLFLIAILHIMIIEVFNYSYNGDDLIIVFSCYTYWQFIVFVFDDLSFFTVFERAFGKQGLKITKQSPVSPRVYIQFFFSKR
mgnify:CR=1 FL=1